jgi:hypothetical protein
MPRDVQAHARELVDNAITSLSEDAKDNYRDFELRDALDEELALLRNARSTHTFPCGCRLTIKRVVAMEHREVTKNCGKGEECKRHGCATPEEIKQDEEHGHGS